MAHLPSGRHAPTELSPGHTIGQYEIIRLLGRGGMGEVYLARDLRLGRRVAIKLLTTQRPDLGERFLAEARTTARCHHENIVVIYEVGEAGEHGGYPYMVLEYLEGQTLRQWMYEHGAAAAAAGQPARLPPGRAMELMLPVVRALAYAHEQGIVHRDLKPENVILTRSGIVKVLDFGIAKLLAAPAPDDESAGAAGRAAVHSSALIGTLPYMSPEQMNVGAIDERTDVWAVGIMLFELVAGAHPVLDANASPATVMAMADEDTPIPLVRERVHGLGPLAAVIDRCLIKDPAYRTPSARVLLAELEALAPARRPVLVGDDGSPFAGLAAFQEADAGRFFGRDHDIDQVVTELRSRPLVAVVGPSGAGKSSLVRAGVIPALRRSGEGWDAHVVRPGREPLAALATMMSALAHRHSSSSELGQSDGGAFGTALGESAGNAVLGSIIERLRAEPGYLGARLRTQALSKLRRMLVFVDQLEELYTQGAPADERAAFLACLAAVADDAASPLRVLVTMRSDFIDRLTEDRRLGAEVTRGLVLLPPMDSDGMREALLRPVEASEHRFEPAALVDRMVDALAATPGALPLLQFTATRLWERRDRERRLLTEVSYDDLGGVAGALAAHADAVLAGMSPAQKALARTVFERMVTPERTRALVTVAELHALHRDANLVDELVQHLAAMRLVVIERGAESAERTVELVHESLIDRWPTLVRWLDENQGDAAMLTRLRSAARDWERSGYAAGLLWTGEAADETRAWHQRYQGELVPSERRYLDAVLAAAERTRRVRRRLFGGILSAAVVVALAMGWLAWEQVQASQSSARAAAEAEQEAMRARDATRMVAMRALSSKPTAQLALLREIENTSAPPLGAAEEAKRFLHADVAPVVLIGHDDVIRSSAFSPDGQRIVSASRDKTVRVWRADGSGESLILRGHEEQVESAAFSPDGQRIVSASEDRTVRVWRADGSGEPLVLRGHEGQVVSAAFSPDGQRIVSASRDKTVRVWRADGSGESLVLRGHEGQVASAAFSPDGQRIVSASEDRTVRVWRADGNGEPLVLRGHEGQVLSVAFSPDGQRIVSASGMDRTVRVWNANGSGEPLVLRGHHGGVISAAFSPDGQHIVSASGDETVRVWRADGSGEPLVLRGHDHMVWSAAFSPDGQRIVSASMDKTVRVWNADGSGEPLVLRGHDDAVVSAVFSPDGQRIVSASEDKTMWVWRADGSGEPLVLRGHEEQVESVAFSPDGQHIVSASGDKTVRVWRADGSGEPLVLRGHDHMVWSAAFSPDGQRIVSASSDGRVRVWNADGSGEPLVLRGHDAPVVSAAFSPDGQRIVSIFLDGTVRVWNTDGSGEPLMLCGPEEQVASVAFSRDGQRIVSASADKTVRVWRADGSGEPLMLRGHDETVESAAFSPDGQRIVSASIDKTVRVWNADGSGEALVLRGHDGWVSWAEFSPDGQYIVSASKDKTIRIWKASGTSELVILAGHPIHQARFSPDGRSIVSASNDHTVRVWHDLAPATLDDPRLWTATTYCMPIERRIELLGVTEEQAQRDRQRCLQRVEQARRAEVASP